LVACDHHNRVTRESLDKLREKATWKVTNFEDHIFGGWSFEQIKSRLGLLKKDRSQLKPVFYGNKNEDLPENFNGADKWPQCIHAIRDQQHCGSCWAFAASEVLSDRFCISSNNGVNVVLSPQDLVSCDGQDFGCEGGYVDKSWDYIRDTGIVSDECLPYTSGDGDSGVCPFDGSKKTCKKGDFKKYQVSSHAQLSTIEDCKSGLFNQGPVEAAFDVYDDFISYSGGVYKRTSDNLLGGHAVKVIGWGKDTDGTEFWVVANSWGPKWGEAGHFRIAFGECSFEEQLWAGVPKVSQD
jgi:cathepsin B